MHLYRKYRQNIIHRVYFTLDTDLFNHEMLQIIIIVLEITKYYKYIHGMHLNKTLLIRLVHWQNPIIQFDKKLQCFIWHKLHFLAVKVYIKKKQEIFGKYFIKKYKAGITIATL